MSSSSSSSVDYDVIIVGAGVAGCSAAYHLMTTMMTKKEKMTNNNDTTTRSSSSFRLLVVDAGPTPGEGIAPTMRSGSATMSSASTSSSKSESNSKSDTTTDTDTDTDPTTEHEEIAPCIKMMVQLFAGSCHDFIQHHGTQGATRYLTATRLGLQYQKHIATQVLQWNGNGNDNDNDNDNDNGDEKEKKKEVVVEQRYQELGSYYVGRTARDQLELKQEFEILASLGLAKEKEIEWCDAPRLATVSGLSSDFNCGIYFPKDAIIDSSMYSKRLLNYVLTNNGSRNSNNCTAEFWPNTIVESISASLSASALSNNDDDKVVVQQVVMNTTTTDTKNKDEDKKIMVTAKKIVIATGAICPSFQCHQQLQQQLNGLMKPCYSYLVHVPTSSPTPTTTPTDKKDSSSEKKKKKDECCSYSSNFFTWGYTHDWCYTKGKIRVSGEDHFSAYKPPQVQQRCQNLARWILERYRNQNNNSNNNTNGTTTHNTCYYTDEQVAAFPQQYGLYSETVDMVPIVGTVVLEGDDTANDHENGNLDVDNQQDRQKRKKETTNVCYLVGCNAWGQTILSYCATLVPGVLGYEEFTDQQREILHLVSIRRFTCLPKK